MTLIEILMMLEGQPKSTRASILKAMGVDKSLWKHIENCFNEKNYLVDGMGKVIRVG